ncbi:MAG: leucine-rich repeat domain-containing protein [Clostridia bacterium]|nr:leucine-rich repeat domain-containing protein [Clostridia bacterium]
MKKSIVLCAILCALLCGCQTGGGSDQPETETQDQKTPTAPDVPDTASGEVQTRLAYYEQLVTDLQQELLGLKTEIFTGRVEYESRIAELEAELEAAEQAMPSVPSDADTAGGEQPSDVANFRYSVTNGAVTITSYIGSDKAVTIPATVEGCPVVAIGDRAFMDNANLTSVTIPDGVTSIGWFAFSGCVSLENVSIPATVQSISYGAFQNCNDTLTVACSVGSYAEAYARSYGMRTKSE